MAWEANMLVVADVNISRVEVEFLREIEGVARCQPGHVRSLSRQLHHEAAQRQPFLGPEA